MNNIFAQIEKYEKLDDDVILISGIASSEAMDNQNEIVKAEAMRDAIPGYLSIGGTGALREMHESTKAAGTVFKADVMDDGRTYIEARVVDKDACKKIEHGVYKGFSIGGKVLKKEGNIITKVKLTEISLVDRPCNPESLFSMYKCDDFEENEMKKIAERKDVNPKEGESKYGDVNFGDEKNKKYPLDTENHIRAAWNYIHQKRNSAKYSAEDVKKIKSRIVSAWKQVIGGEPPAAEAKKADAVMNQQLGLGLVSRLSCIIADLQALQQLCAYEEEMELDKSELPKDLTIAITNLYDILIRMAQEEFEEFNEYNSEVKMSDNTKDLNKYDAQTAKDSLGSAKVVTVTPQQSPKFDDVTSKVNSQQSKQIDPKEIMSLFSSVDEIKRKMVEMGYIEDSEIIKPTSVEWGEKSEKTEDLSKVLSGISSKLDSMSERLTKIEGQPVNAKAILKNVPNNGLSVITKSSDLDGKELAKVDRNSFENMKLEEKDFAVMDVIKSIHSGKI